MAVEYRIATVLSIEENLLQMVDKATANIFIVNSSTPGGVGAIPGDIWLLDMTLGVWALKQCIQKASDAANPARNLAEVMATLETRQLVNTSFPDSGTPEALHLAKIGEVRYISYAPDPFWWPEADGATVQRLKYRELGSVIDPGTSPTFDLPLVPILGTVLPYVCAR
jgi:hypothetical protein